MVRTTSLTWHRIRRCHSPQNRGLSFIVRIISCRLTWFMRGGRPKAHGVIALLRMMEMSGRCAIEIRISKRRV